MAHILKRKRDRERLQDELQAGDCLKQPEFHHLYENMPDGYRAELVGGMVFEPSPVSWGHAAAHAELTYLLKTYARKTFGVSAASDATVILGDEDEVQPDVLLKIAEEHRGQSRITRIKRKNYVSGAPELVAEVAYSSRALDLHFKRRRYALAGVREYVVVCLEPANLYWFDLHEDRRLCADVDGIYRSTVFPGLWLHAENLLSGDEDSCLSVLEKGISSPGHADFVERLKSYDTKKR